MAVIDTLQILIEADASGLETQLKRGMDTVSRFVDKANSQELDWQKILAGTLDTAIIGGIASSFAIAITQAVGFQNSLLNLNNSAAGTSSAMDAATGSISSGLVNAATQAGASLGDTASAYEALYKQIGDASGAQSLTGQIGEIAMELGTNLTTLMPQIIDLFNQWGITSLPAAESALQGLVESAGQGKFSFSELLNIISQQGPILQSRTNVSDLALQLQALSNVSTLSKGTIENNLSAIANSVANPLSTMNLLAGTGKAFTGPDGLITAMQKLNGFLSQAGATAQTFGAQFGLSASTVTQDANTSASALKGAKSATDDMRKSLVDLDTYLAAHESVTTKFQKDWALIMNTLGQNIGVPVLETIIADFDEISHLFNAAKTGGFVGFITSLLGDVGSAFTQNLSKIMAPVTSMSAKPTANGTQSNMGPVTLNITNNIAGGAPTGHQIMGQSIGDKAYNAFMGLMASL